jgi:pSer/pThr/pTyr-binding forkhead associated (FHA) protein
MVVVFKKLFGRKEVPTKDGKSASSSKVDGVRWVKKFVLQLTNMEGSPTYNLTHQLTVGSEMGNIVIADASVSPRHCTFILQENIVSVLDHGSLAGTFINGKKIPPGRYIILEESDRILVGELEVKIHVATDAVQDDISHEKLDEEAEEEEVEEVEDEEIVQDQPKEKSQKASKFAFFKKWFAAKPKAIPSSGKKDAKKSKAFSFSTNSPYATNSIVRLMAVICDFIIAYALTVVFSPFDEFQSFVNDVPVMLGDLLDLDWKSLWSILNEEYAFLGEMLKDLYGFFSSTFYIGPLVFMFILVRLLSTLLFGVSFSELFLGVRSHGNAIWKRIGGVLRVVIGVFTGPFLIFDVPAVVSRKTFKEFMTFTHTYVISKFFSILGVLLYFPAVIAFALLAPLVQGLELPEPIAVNDKLDMRVRVAAPAVPPTDIPEVVVKSKDRSEFFKMDLEFEGQNISLFPSFKFSGKKTVLSYKPELIVYHKDLQRSVVLEVFKTFDLKQLLSIGMKGDFFLEGKFPQIETFIHSPDAIDPAFKIKNDEKVNRKFADEVVSFTKTAFELSAENAFDLMQTHTPFLQGLMDYRSSFLSLIEYKTFDQIDFLKLGNAYFLRISYSRQKPFDLIIPLIQGQGRIFKVEFDKKENLSALRNKFYKFSMVNSNWFPVHEAKVESETFRPLQVLDFFSAFKMRTDKISSDNAQALYGYYFEKSAEIFKKDDTAEYQVWKKSIEAIFTIMSKVHESVPKLEAVEASETPAVEIVEDPRTKLFQNFSDLKEAVETKNKTYFGIQESTTI